MLSSSFHSRCTLRRETALADTPALVEATESKRTRFTSLSIAAPLLLALFSPCTVIGSVVSPDSSSVTVDFACHYTGAYETGKPYDTITISPEGVPGETFAAAGITIQVCLRDGVGNPIVGMPAEKIVLDSPRLCLRTRQHR